MEDADYELRNLRSAECVTIKKGDWRIGTLLEPGDETLFIRCPKCRLFSMWDHPVMSKRDCGVTGVFKCLRPHCDGLYTLRLADWDNRASSTSVEEGVRPLYDVQDLTKTRSR